MTKFILTIFLLIVLCFAYRAFINRNDFVSFDNDGSKIIRTECSIEDEFKCYYNVGKICENGGYIELNKNTSQDVVVLLVKCGEKPKCFIRNFF